MRSELPLLDTIEIAAPCPMSWATMDGSTTKRFCDSCRLHVHDLSAMTAQEAETLLQTHRGELCVRYTQDSSGRIVTDEFPTPLRPLRALVLKHCAMATAFVLLALTAGVQQASAETPRAKAKTVVVKKAGKKLEAIRTMGTPAVRATPASDHNEGLMTKMGEPVARPAEADKKNAQNGGEGRIFLGGIRAVSPKKGQEIKTLSHSEKTPSKPEK